MFVERQYFPSQRSLLEKLVYGHNDYKLKLVLHPGVNRRKGSTTTQVNINDLFSFSWQEREPFSKPALKSECTPTIKILEKSRMWQKRTLLPWMDAMRKFKNGQATVKQPWRPLSTGSLIPGAAPQLHQPIPQLPDTALNHNPWLSFSTWNVCFQIVLSASPAEKKNHSPCYV